MSPAESPAIDYKTLVQDDRIHASLYTDPRIFADEMDRIFHAGWVFVGHEARDALVRGPEHASPAPGGRRAADERQEGRPGQRGRTTAEPVVSDLMSTVWRIRRAALTSQCRATTLTS
jgi:hypothetical protein